MTPAQNKCDHDFVTMSDGHLQCVKCGTITPPTPDGTDLRGMPLNDRDVMRLSLAMVASQIRDATIQLAGGWQSIMTGRQAELMPIEKRPSVIRQVADTMELYANLSDQVDVLGRTVVKLIASNEPNHKKIIALLEFHQACLEIQSEYIKRARMDFSHPQQPEEFQ